MHKHVTKEDLFQQIRHNKRGTKYIMAYFGFLSILFSAMFSIFSEVFFSDGPNGDFVTEDKHGNVTYDFHIPYELGAKLVYFMAFTVILLIISLIIWYKIRHCVNGFASDVNAMPIDRKASPNFWDATSNLSVAAGIPMPKLYIINDSSLNDFPSRKTRSTLQLA